MRTLTLRPSPTPRGGAAAPEVALEARGVTKAYGAHRALHDVSLTVARGQVTALLGPNGAGKTTFLSIVAGLLRADAGTIRLNGWDVATEPLRAQRTLGFAPQNTGLYEPLTVQENLAFFGQLADLRGPRLERRIDAVSEALLLSDLRTRPCQSLSGGERRRVHTGIALIAQPPLLLLDEPTVGADIETRSALVAMVHDLAADGSAVVYTTHYLPEVEELAAHVVLIDRGEVVADGDIDSLVAAHGSGELDLRFAGVAPTVTIDGVILRPEHDHLVVTTAEPATLAARILHQLGDDVGQLEDVRITRPSLESVFHRLTGRRLAGSEGVDDAA